METSDVLANAGSERRPAALAAVVALLIGLLAWAPPAVAADAIVGAPITYDGPSYPSSVNRPSENKPQSKLWYADGSWWALMATGTATSVRIHQLMPDHSWRDTGTVVDERLNSTGDALWEPLDGKLFVASRTSGSDLQVSRFSYTAAADAWNVDTGFPVTVSTGGGSESATMDRDSTGKLWLTYTQKSRLYVANSHDSTGATWTAGYLPKVPDVVISSDDISALIAFQGRIGLLWSDQQSGAFRFALHKDTDPVGPDAVWSVEDALLGTTLADDHINLKQLSADSQGRIFAAVKTSNDLQGPDAPLVGVLIRTPGTDGAAGSWQFVPAGTVADDHTRPIVMIDETNSELYFFATAPVSGGDIYYKKTSLANPQFAPGRGTLFVDSQRQVNNAAGAKHPVSAATGMVILAVAEGVKRYAHAEMALAGGGTAPPADTTAPTTPTGLAATGGTGRVDLTWNASTDNVGVTGYIVQRDGVTIGTVQSLSFEDLHVVAGTSYSYTVRAVDAANNSSAPTSAVSVTPTPVPGSGIALRGVSTGVNGTATSVTVDAPARQPGDLLLATVDFRGNRTVTTPTGWTLLRLDNNGTALRKATYWKTAGAAEPSSYTWVFNGKPPAVATVLAYSGVSTASPVASSSGQINGSSTRVTAPSVNAPAGSLVVGLFGISQLALMTPPSDMTERSDRSTPAGQRYPVTGETADATLDGASGVKVATASAAGRSIGQLIALTPAG